MEKINQSKHEEERLDLRLSQQSVKYLKSSAKWIKYFSILGFILSGLFMTSAIINLLPVSSTQLQEARPMYSLWLAASILIFVPSRYLYKCSSKIKVFLKNRDNDQIENVLLLQNKYWTFISITNSICLVLLLLSFFVFILGDFV